jgi:hypothetical protein
MSQTLTKRIQIAASPDNIAQAFALMGLAVEQNAPLGLYRGSQTVALKIPSAVLVQLGFPPTAFSDGVGLDFQDGQITFVYDHYNQSIINDLSPYIEALNAIGAQAENLQALSARGYTFEPVFDLARQEIGIRAVALEQPGQASAWGTSENGGGLW